MAPPITGVDASCRNRKLSALWQDAVVHFINPITSDDKFGRWFNKKTQKRTTTINKSAWIVGSNRLVTHDRISDDFTRSCEMRRPSSSTPVHGGLTMGFFGSVFSWVMKSILDDGLLVF